MNDKLYRVVFAHDKDLIIIKIHDKIAWPEHFDALELEDLLIRGQAKLSEDPFEAHNLKYVEEGSTSYLKMEGNWNIIKNEINNFGLFNSSKRGKIVSGLMDKYSKGHQTINRLFRRYWQRGMSKTAMLPDYYNCGSKGKAKRVDGQKLGRKRSISPGIGTNISEEMKRILRRIIAQKLFRKKETPPNSHVFTLWRNLIKSQFPNIKSEHDLPTIEQMDYIIKKEYTEVEIKRKQFNKTDFDREFRPLMSTSTAESIGPGYRYQIDATIADVYLVSDSDESRVIGRPTMYFVMDVFSRTCCGLYIGLENPSWVSAMMAISNAVENKVDFCKKYGIDITEEKWPCRGLPSCILADKGELKGTNIESFILANGVSIENAAARRGDLKGIVEKYFDTIQATFKPYMPGIVTPIRSMKKGCSDYRKEAAYTFSEFYEMIISIVIWHNNNNVNFKYDRCEDLPPDIASVPIDLWNWGIKNLTGKLRSVDSDLVKLNLLPHAKATTSDYGICFKGCYYKCKEAIEKEWFHRKAGKRPRRVSIAYDPRSVNRIYIRPSKNFKEYWVCYLSDRSRRFFNKTFWEVDHVLKEENKTNKIASIKSYTPKGKLLEDIDSKSKKARERARKLSMSASQKIKNIKQNREKEKALERQKNYFAFSDESKFKVDDPDICDEENEFSYPSHFDIIANKGELSND